MGSVIAFGTTVTLLLGLVWAATGSPGRWAVMHFAGGSELPRGLILEIDGLSGNVLHRPTVERLTISDVDGIFLTLENIALDWDGFALIRGDIDINEIATTQIELVRQPILTPSAGGGGALPPIRVGAISVSHFLLGEAVIGESASFSIQGEGRMRNNGRLALDILRTDIPGDRISSEVRWLESGEISGSANAFISGSGPIASLLKLDGRDAELSGQMTGTADRGVGEVNMTLAGESAANANFDWQNGRWSTRMDANGNVLEAIRSLPFNPQARIEAEGSLSPLRPDQIIAEGQGWQLNVTPTGAQRADVNISLSQPIWEALAGDSVIIDETRWSGSIDYRSGVLADGILETRNIRFGETSIEALGGSLLFTRSNGQNSIFVDLTATQIALPESAPLSILPWAGLAFEARETSGIYVFDELSLTSDLLELSGDIQLDPEGWVLNGDTSLALLDLSSLTDLASGTASADLRIQSLSQGGVMFEADLHGGDILWLEETLATLLSQTEASARIESDFTNWRVEGLTLDSAGAIVRGEASGEGVNWATTLDAAVNTDLAFGETIIGGGAVIALEAQGESLSAAGNAVISTPSFEIAGRTVTQPRLGLDFIYSRDHQTANWQLETQSEFGSLRTTGALDRSASRTQLTIDEGQFERFGFTGDAELNADGYTATLNGRDWPIPNGELESLNVTASNRTGNIIFTADAVGALRDPFSVSAQAILTDGQVSTDLTADWAGIPISTTHPIVYQFGGETPSLTGRLNTGGGQTRIRWTAEEQLRVAVTGLPAGIIATAATLPAMDGTIDLDLALRYRDDRWSGSIEATGNEFQVRQIRLGSAVDFGLTGRLGDNFDLTLTVTGDDLSGRAELSRGGAISDLRQLADDASLSGAVELSGAIEPLLALAIPDTRQLAGQLSADLIVSGTVFRPELNGETRFANGRYVSEELGVAVDDVNAVAIWENGRLRIESFTATGPRGGELTVSGEGGLGADGWEADANAEFVNFNAVRRPDLSVVVTGNSDINFSRGRASISGDVTLNRIDARPPEASAPSFAEIEVTEVNRADGSDGRPPRRIPVALNVRIRADDGIFVSGEAFSTEWRGDWHVTGSPTAPMINGDAVLVYGRAFLLNRAFRMEEGRVSMSGGISTAEINLLAQHQRDSLTVDARISGPVSSPTLSLSSQPALPEDEILARLLFDRNSGQLSPLETATIAAQLSGQNLFGIVGGLRRAAGLDRLDFAAGENGEVVVTGGRQLTDDVYLELESRGTALSSARLEWTLTPDFTLLSRLTGDTEASVALRWRTEY